MLAHFIAHFIAHIFRPSARRCAEAGYRTAMTAFNGTDPTRMYTTVLQNAGYTVQLPGCGLRYPRTRLCLKAKRRPHAA